MAMVIPSLYALLLTLFTLDQTQKCHAFLPAYRNHYTLGLTSQTISQSSHHSTFRLSAVDKATLTDETTWRMRINLRDTPGQKSSSDPVFFVTELKFVEEEGYEPPQGTVQQISAGSDNDSAHDEKKKASGRLRIRSGRWMLSEDPEDRKDGLWVWGLFKEPLYPYLLLRLETEEVLSPSSSESDTPSTMIPPLTLYAQIPHSREKENGAVLGMASVSVREVERVSADLFGAATADLYENVGVGQISFTPVSSTSSISS